MKDWQIKPWDGYETITIRNTLINPETQCRNWQNICQVERMKDARLIVAAPELLDALKNALNVLAGLAVGDLKNIQKDSPAIKRARDAIKKAEKT